MALFGNEHTFLPEDRLRFDARMMHGTAHEGGVANSFEDLRQQPLRRAGGELDAHIRTERITVAGECISGGEGPLSSLKNQDQL